MTAYDKPYTVRGWGDEVVTTVTLAEAVPDGYLPVVRDRTGPVILVPTVSLTPVDTTPAEPEPGPYQVGRFVVIVAKNSNAHFYIDPLVPTICGWKPWRDLVTGAVITEPVEVVRLVPEPAPVERVELPWHAADGWWSVDHDGDGEVTVSTPGGRHYGRMADEAEALAAALLTAARAAREARS